MLTWNLLYDLFVSLTIPLSVHYHYLLFLAKMTWISTNFLNLSYFHNFHVSGSFSVVDHASELLLYRFTSITKTHFQWFFICTEIEKFLNSCFISMIFSHNFSNFILFFLVLLVYFPLPVSLRLSSCPLFSQSITPSKTGSVKGCFTFSLHEKIVRGYFMKSKSILLKFKYQSACVLWKIVER